MPQQAESTTPQFANNETATPSAPVEPFDHQLSTDNEPEIIYTEPISVGASHTIMGGAASLGTSGVGESEVPPMAHVMSLDEPDLDTLLLEMKNSVGEISLVGLLLDEPAWQAFFASLTPAQFASIVSSVQSSFDETGMAVLLARSIEHFSCEHASKAVQKASEFSRTNLVEKLLPHCVDLATNYKQIKAVLTEWEHSVTERAFDKELAARQC